jgi:hypothetical protein
VRHTEVAAAYPRQEGLHTERVREVLASTQAAKENIDRMNNELSELHQQRELVQESLRGLKSKREHMEKMITQAEPRTRYIAGPQI